MRYIIICLCVFMLLGCKNQKQADRLRELEVCVALQNAVIEIQDKAIKDLTKLVKKIEADLNSIPRWSRLPPRME